MKLLFEFSLGGDNSSTSTSHSFPYGLAATIIAIALIFPQTSDFFENSPPIKVIRSLISSNLVNTESKSSIDNGSTSSNKVFPLKGYTAQSVRYSALVGECRPLGSCTRSHAGVDIPAPLGTPVLSVLDGVISEIDPENSVGGILGIKSGNQTTRYLHINRDWVRKWKIGDKVQSGQQIAEVDWRNKNWGSGAHLHFEHYQDGRLNKHPEKWLAKITSNNSSIANKNLKAFLDTIAWAETGTAGEEGYKSLVFGGKLTNFNSHPNTKQCAPINGKRICSTAAGRYQMLNINWKELQPKLDLSDFSPASQDKMAIELIKRKGAYQDVLAGDFDSAARKVGGIWASFPNNNYGQNPKSLARLRNFYQLRLGNGRTN